MVVDTRSLVSLTEANQNFSRVARLVDELGSVVILRNNIPRYVLIDYDQLPEQRSHSDEDTADDETVLEVGRHMLAQYRPAFEELAK